MSARERVHQLVDQLPEESLSEVLQYLARWPETTKLPWTREETEEVRASLASFEEDWNAPGMEAYDRL